MLVLLYVKSRDNSTYSTALVKILEDPRLKDIDFLLLRTITTYIQYTIETFLL
jgi:hypothetical protein